MTLADQIRNRIRAAQRLEADERGYRDPYLDKANEALTPTMRHETIVQLAYLGCTITQDQYRHAWTHSPEHRPLLDAVASAQHEGWQA